MSGKGSKRKEENAIISTLLEQRRLVGAEVFFSHFRIGPPKDAPADVIAEHTGFATIALAVFYRPGEGDKLLYSSIDVGWAFCSPKDTFRASRGRLGAVRRLVSREYINMSSGSRNELPKRK
jgi:hypothetical protein